MPSEANRLRVNERPPMRQYILATAPGGRTERWGFDGTNPANILEDFTDSDAANGGCKDFTAALPRKPGVDYSDMKLGTRIAVFGAGGYKVSEYRLERTPRTSGDLLVMDPGASGYQVLLSDDEGAREIFIDANQGGWRDPSTERRLIIEASAWLSGSTEIGWQGTGTEGPGIIQRLEAIGLKARYVESWYDGEGVALGGLYFYAKQSGIGIASNWKRVSSLVDTDVSIITEGDQHDHEAANEVWLLKATTASRRYARFGFERVATEPSESGSWQARWIYPKVLGTHGLTLYGTWPEVGVLASDVITYLLSRFVPSLRYTTGSNGTVKPSSVVISHLAFKEPTTVLDMIEQTLRFEGLEWGVWPGQFGPTFFLNQRGQREGRQRWRVRTRPAQLTETGQQMDLCFNRVVISWTDVDGTNKVLGPPGSGYPLTDARCEDLDPQNPINAGEPRTKHLSMDGPATVEGAAETARLFLERCKLLDGAGEATLTGYVEDEHGAEWPYYCVKATDEIEFLGSSLKGYRYIVEATRNRKQRAVNIKIDAPPDSYEALLAELQVRETAGGF